MGGLSRRKVRRGILLGWTLFTLCLVIGGVSLLNPLLNRSPFWFTLFWTACFVCAVLVLVLALVDMRMIRKEHRGRHLELDAELAKIVSDAEAMAEQLDRNDSS